MYSPRHARPSCLPVRTAVGTGLSAVLLPIAMAAPALATEATPATSATASPASTSEAVAAQSTEASPTAAPQPTATQPTSTLGGLKRAGQPAAATTTSPVTAVAAAAPAAMRDSRSETVLRISATATDDRGHSRVGARLLDEQGEVQDGTVAIERQTATGWEQVTTVRTDAEGLGVASLPFSEDTTLRATYAGSDVRHPQVSDTVVAQRRAITTMRISATEAGGDGHATIGVRLLADNRAVQNGYVALERATGSGWEYIGRLLTDAEGLGQGRLPFAQDTRIRATYSGAETRTTGVSPEIVVKASNLGQRAVQFAAQQQGKPYRYGSAGPDSFDCSGLTGYVWRAVGKSLPRTSRDQANATTRIPNSAKQPGDLIFFSTNGTVGHVGIYAGNGQMWDAPRSGTTVQKRAIYSSNYFVGRV